MTTTQEQIDYQQIATELGQTLRLLEAVSTGYIEIDNSAEEMLNTMAEQCPLSYDAYDFLFNNEELDSHVDRVKSLAEAVGSDDPEDEMANALAELLLEMFDGDEDAALTHLESVIFDLVQEFSE